MKQKDIALILIVIFFGGMVSFTVSKFIFKSSEKNLQSDVVTSITSEFVEPDKKYFNEQSIDPTQIIRIGDGTNTQPFSQ